MPLADDPELPGLTSVQAAERRDEDAPVTVAASLIEESVRTRPIEAIISRIHAIYIAHRRAHNVQAQIKKHRELYGLDGVHGLCVALERNMVMRRKQGSVANSICALEKLRTQAPMTLPRPGLFLENRRRIRRRSVPAFRPPPLILGKDQVPLRAWGLFCILETNVWSIFLLHRDHRYRWQTKDIPGIGRMVGPDRSSPIN